jgi:hypothetical protein
MRLRFGVRRKELRITDFPRYFIYRIKDQDVKEVIPSSVAIFTDFFGPLNSKDVLSLYYESLANNLKRSGHSITIIYTGGFNAQFSKVSSFYGRKDIDLVM